MDYRVGTIRHLQAIRARDQQFDAVFGHPPKHCIDPGIKNPSHQTLYARLVANFFIIRFNK